MGHDLSIRRLSRTIGLSMSLALALGFQAHAQADDLVALAKKEKARRAKLSRPSKVLTEADGKAAAETAAVTTINPNPVPEPAPAVATSSAVSDAARDDWKARAQAVRAAVAAAQAEIDQMVDDLAAFRSDLAPLSAAEAQDPLRLQKRQQKIADMNDALGVKRQILANAQMAVQAFEDEARRAGVPPGWLR